MDSCRSSGRHHAPVELIAEGYYDFLAQGKAINILRGQQSIECQHTPALTAMDSEAKAVSPR
ncbi:hypothetical protein [Candidatus Reidiella endopervernicosa]|uniref:Uncharacterized protein n=1 Tax=Candidatus Reidiella endopervernicosa TaxID=2738883 RepID=A0A6N0HWP6_9GAMM|nr:hypothetical protein [Candidatus Reidiella endopervernicosa]QKQ26784.1 hypothetical protein HUE57_11180 [Candidatus Reidiella endopervernicosa]